MITAKVYLVKTDTATVAHCGHPISAEGEYYMLRTDLPMWMSLCPSCVALLSTPIKLTIGEMVEMFRVRARRPKQPTGTELVVARRKRVVSKEKEEKDLKKAEWV